MRERIQVAREGRDAGDEARQRLPFPESAPRDPDFYDYCGAVHVHSTYSDGAGTVKQVAEAANEAGLDFVILNDHATLQPRTDGQDGWHGRTLVMVGTEVGTDAGHLLVLDVPDSFLPSSGSATNDQQRILESGGIGFIALPCDLKDHWRDFSARLPGIGLEVFNLSAIARTKINLPALAMIWRRYNGKKPERAFHLVSARPTAELRLWDSMMQPARLGEPYEPVVAIGSLDAHAVMKFAGRSYPFPTYHEVFRTLRTHVLLDHALKGVMGTKAGADHSGPDQKSVHSAIRSGHCYIAYDNYGDSTGFVFKAVAGDDKRFLMGDSLEITPGESPIRLIATAPRSRSFVRLYRDGKLIATARGGRLEHTVTQPGAYRVEVFVYRRRIGSLCLGSKPWIFSNPIYLQPCNLNASLAGEAKDTSRRYHTS